MHICVPAKMDSFVSNIVKKALCNIREGKVERGQCKREMVLLVEQLKKMRVHIYRSARPLLEPTFIIFIVANGKWKMEIANAYIYRSA